MIQRKQSLFLLGALILSILLLYIPVFEILPDPADTTNIMSGESFVISKNTILGILNGSVAVLCVVCIFLFKSRNLQIRICNLTLLLTCIMIGLLFFLSDTFSGGESRRIHYLFGIYLPLIQIVLIFLASVFIRKDEKLVRSADRLR